MVEDACKAFERKPQKRSETLLQPTKEEDEMVKCGSFSGGLHVRRTFIFL